MAPLDDWLVSIYGGGAPGAQQGWGQGPMQGPGGWWGGGPPMMPMGPPGSPMQGQMGQGPWQGPPMPPQGAQGVPGNNLPPEVMQAVQALMQSGMMGGGPPGGGGPGGPGGPGAPPNDMVAVAGRMLGAMGGGGPKPPWMQSPPIQGYWGGGGPQIGPIGGGGAPIPGQIPDDMSGGWSGPFKPMPGPAPWERDFPMPGQPGGWQTPEGGGPDGGPVMSPPERPGRRRPRGQISVDQGAPQSPPPPEEQGGEMPPWLAPTLYGGSSDSGWQRGDDIPEMAQATDDALTQLTQRASRRRMRDMYED
jgi:hypothetical protein